MSLKMGKAPISTHLGKTAHPKRLILSADRIRRNIMNRPDFNEFDFDKGIVLLNDNGEEFINYLVTTGQCGFNSAKTYRNKLVNYVRNLTHVNYWEILASADMGKDNGLDHNLIAALRKFADYLVYLDLREVKEVEDHRYEGIYANTLVIPHNVVRLGNGAFYNAHIKNIIICHGSLQEGSGSRIFEGAQGLKKVMAPSYEELRFPYDTKGSPYKKGVKAYVDEEEVPIIEMVAERGFSVWRALNAVEKMEIYNERVHLWIRDKKDGIIEKEFSMDKDSYEELIGIFRYIKDSSFIPDSFVFTPPKAFDVPAPPKVSFTYLGLTTQSCDWLSRVSGLKGDINRIFEKLVAPYMPIHLG